MARIDKYSSSWVSFLNIRPNPNQKSMKSFLQDRVTPMGDIPNQNGVEGLFIKKIEPDLG
jgi:hypothetical protein